MSATTIIALAITAFSFSMALRHYLNSRNRGLSEERKELNGRIEYARIELSMIEKAKKELAQLEGLLKIVDQKELTQIQQKRRYCSSYWCSLDCKINDIKIVLGVEE